VIGGYTPSPKNLDALIFGYYEHGKLIYVARTRNGFTPSIREKLLRQFKGLHTNTYPFSNFPEAKSGRWGVGLTASKMRECRWLAPALVPKPRLEMIAIGQRPAAHWKSSSHERR